RREAAIRALRAISEITDETDTDDRWEEIYRNTDEGRPHRKLFEGMYRTVAGCIVADDGSAASVPSWDKIPILSFVESSNDTNGIVSHDPTLAHLWRRLAALAFAFFTATQRRSPLATPSRFTGRGPL